MKPRRLLLPGAALLVIAVVIALALSSTTTSHRPAPALPRRVLQPPTVTLASLRGRPAIVHFFASWCEPCQKEAPQIAALQHELHSRASLVGVDYSDSTGNALAFIHQHRWSFTVLADNSGLAGQEYGIVGLPTTFLLDGDGRIVKRLPGPQTSQSILASLRSAS